MMTGPSGVGFGRNLLQACDSVGGTAKPALGRVCSAFTWLRAKVRRPDATASDGGMEPATTSMD